MQVSVYNRKTLSCERVFHFLSCIYKPNFVSFAKAKEMTIYLGLKLLLDSSDSSLDFSRDTILHRSKYLAVSAGLNRVVSVRNSILLWKGVTLYFSQSLPGLRCVRTFLPLALNHRVVIQCRTI